MRETGGPSRSSRSYPPRTEPKIQRLKPASSATKAPKASNPPPRRRPARESFRDGPPVGARRQRRRATRSDCAPARWLQPDTNTARTSRRAAAADTGRRRSRRRSAWSSTARRCRSRRRRRPPGQRREQRGRQQCDRAPLGQVAPGQPIQGHDTERGHQRTERKQASQFASEIQRHQHQADASGHFVA